MATDSRFIDIYSTLHAYYGPQNWWPADSPLEMLVGAVLTQNTSWTNVEKAIRSLKAAGVMNFEALVQLSIEGLADLIRPAGYFNRKAQRLKNLLHMIEQNYSGDIGLLLDQNTEVARMNLLQVKGVGQETADSILLYAGNHAIFVVDAYTHRVFSRHHLVNEECSYEELQECFHDNLETDSVVFNEYHALIVRVAKEFCRKRNPLCEQCPLRVFLPE